MRYDRILRRVWVKIDGREYALVFSLSVFEKLDAENDGNLIVQLSQGDTPYKLLSHAFKLALQQADKKITDPEAEALLEKFVYAEGLPSLSAVFWITVAVSGLMGAKVSRVLFERMAVAAQDVDGLEDCTEADEKNGVKPEE